VCSGFLPSVVDGALLDVTVMVPHGRGPHPLIVIMHGWGGDKSGWGDFATTLLGDGFAIVRYSARGFGASWGQVNLADVHVELEDLRSLIAQVVDDRRLRLKLSGGASLLIAGEPVVSLRAATLAHRVQLNVRLFDVRPDGAEHLVTRGTVTLDSGAAARPLGTVDVTIPTYGNVWEATAESVLRLEITNLDSPYIAPSRVPSVTEISNVRLEVPAR
jgi:predicted acyl esterase